MVADSSPSSSEFLLVEKIISRPTSGLGVFYEGTSALGPFRAFFSLEPPLEEDGLARFAMAWQDFLIEHSLVVFAPCYDS